MSMKTKFNLLTLALAIGHVAWAGQVPEEPIVGEGDSLYYSAAEIPPPEGFHGDATRFEGNLFVNGQSAVVLYNDMVDVEEIPARSDLKKISPAEATLTMFRRKYGKNVSCIDIGQTNKDATKWKLDKKGNIVTEMSCMFQFANSKTGELEVNK